MYLLSTPVEVRGVKGVCVHACMCACMHVYVYTCVCMYVCMYACVCIHVYVCMYACMCVCMYVCVHACVCGGQDVRVGRVLTVGTVRGVRCACVCACVFV